MNTNAGETTTDRPNDVVESPLVSSDVRRRRRSLTGTSGFWVGAVSPAIFALVAVIYSVWLGNDFANSNTRLLDLHQNTPILLVALGLCLCLIAGQFDLSVGGVATLTTFLALGLSSNQDVPFPFALVLCLAAGAATGLVNATLVIRFRVNAFIATLATGGIVLGLSHVYSGGSAFTPAPGAVPEWFSGLGSLGSFQSRAPVALTWAIATSLVLALAAVVIESADLDRQRAVRTRAGIASVVVAAVLAVVMFSRDSTVPWTVFILYCVTMTLWIMLRYTTFGRELYAVGGNPVAARLAGVGVGRRTTAAFVLSGTLAGAAGVILAANQGSASPDIAVPYLIPAFASVFLSTVLFSTGRFHVWGTVLGGYLLVMVSQGLIIAGLPFTWTDVVNGVVLAFAVAFSTALRGSGRHV